MALGAVADDAAVIAGEVDREDQAVRHMRAAPSTSRDRPWSAISAASSRRATPRRKRICDSREPARTTTGKGARAHLEIERPVIAGGNRIEGPGAVGDDAGEDVEPSGGAIWDWPRRRDRRGAPGSPSAARCRRSRSPAPRSPRDRSHAASAFPAVRHGASRPGQEARADAIGDRAEAEVEARRLDLVGVGKPSQGGPCRPRSGSRSPCAGRIPAFGHPRPLSRKRG